jgi:hypothetical protein
MSAPIETFYIQSWATNIALLAQQMDCRLAGAVMVGNYKGEAASPVEQVGSVRAQKNSSRGTAIRPIEAPTDRPWVYPEDYNLPQLVYKADELRMVVDPKSAFVQNAVAAMNRAKDDEIVAAFFADRKTGKNGGTTTTWPAGQVVSVNKGGNNSGLNVAKLKAAKRLLLAANIDPAEQLFCAITAAQNDDLLNEYQVVSKEFNAGDAPLVEGNVIKRFLGFNFIHTEELAVNGSSQRRVPAWAKSGMHLGVWNDIKTDISVRKDIEGLPTQLYVEGTFGATRTEEKKVVEIPCVES